MFGVLLFLFYFLSTDRRFPGDFICGSGCSAAFMAGLIASAVPKPHRCEYKGCSKSYAKAKQLKVHVSAEHHGERHGPCPCCGLTFAAKHSLVSHLKRKRLQISTEVQELQQTRCQIWQEMPTTVAANDGR